MSEWKILSDLVERKICYGIVQPGNKGGNVPIIKVNNIIAGLNTIENLETTTEEIASKYERTKLKGGELIISLVGTVGATAIVPHTFAGCNLVRATGMIDIVDEILARYVKYFLETKSAKEFLYGRLNTTVQPTLNVKTLENLPIPIIDRQKMNTIVSILSALDDKIAINRRICENLEAQAQALFKHWFIDFAPFKDGKFIDSELGMIPEGWRVCKLGSFFPIRTGKKDANIAISTGQYPFFSCSQNILSTDVFSFDGSAILVAGNGDFNVKWYEGKFEAYQRTYVLMPYESSYTHFLFYAIQFNLRKITCGAGGTVIKFIRKADLENFKIAIPQELDKCDVISVFSEINKNIAKISAESSCLATLRDTLLPKLMSGQIKV